MSSDVWQQNDKLVEKLKKRWSEACRNNWPAAIDFFIAMHDLAKSPFARWRFAGRCPCCGRKLTYRVKEI